MYKVNILGKNTFTFKEIFDKYEYKKLFSEATKSVKNSILFGLDKKKIRWKNN